MDHSNRKIDVDHGAEEAVRVSLLRPTRALASAMRAADRGREATRHGLFATITGKSSRGNSRRWHDFNFINFCCGKWIVAVEAGTLLSAEPDSVGDLNTIASKKTRTRKRKKG